MIEDYNVSNTYSEWIIDSSDSLTGYTQFQLLDAVHATSLATTGTLRVGGNIYADGEVESYDTSDIRLKENVSDIDPERALRLLHSRVIEYDHKEKGKREIGLIAQEVMEIFPEVVKEDQDGNLMIHYGKLVAALLSIIQNQEDRITKLEKTVYNGSAIKQHQHKGRNVRAWTWKFWNK
jgi:hypothetical protein